MKQRGIVAVILLTLVTFGIYMIVWMVKTKNEMNRCGADIPTAWLSIVPIVNIWWLWRYCQGVDTVSRGRLGAAVSFLLLAVLGVIGMAIVQDAFNKSAISAPSAMPRAAALP